MVACLVESTQFYYRIAGKVWQIVRDSPNYIVLILLPYMARAIHSPNFSSLNTHNSESAKLFPCQTSHYMVIFE